MFEQAHGVAQLETLYANNNDDQVTKAVEHTITFFNDDEMYDGTTGTNFVI